MRIAVLVIQLRFVTSWYMSDRVVPAHGHLQAVGKKPKSNDGRMVSQDPSDCCNHYRHAENAASSRQKYLAAVSPQYSFGKQRAEVSPLLVAVAAIVKHVPCR